MSSNVETQLNYFDFIITNSALKLVYGKFRFNLHQILRPESAVSFGLFIPFLHKEQKQWKNVNV